MNVLYYILLGLGLLVAVVFALLVFITGKGDAMSGGSSVRTTYKGKASFDDMMSRITLGLGITFMVLMIIIDIVGNQMPKNETTRRTPAAETPASNPPATTPNAGTTGTTGSAPSTGTTSTTGAEGK